MSTRTAQRARDVASLLLTSAVVLVARASFADHYRVPSGSMEPTVTVGDQICVNKLAYGVRLPASETYVLSGRGPQRGEVVVLVSPVNGDVLLKRVVAVPGDLVAVVEGQLVIDGRAVPEHDENGAVIEDLGAHSHAIGTAFGGGPDLASTRVPTARYLVMGDNRGNSFDGRYFGLVARNAIIGRAAAVCLHDGKPTWQPL